MDNYLNITRHIYASCEDKFIPFNTIFRSNVVKLVSGHIQSDPIYPLSIKRRVWSANAIQDNMATQPLKALSLKLFPDKNNWPNVMAISFATRMPAIHLANNTTTGHELCESFNFGSKPDQGCNHITATNRCLQH